MIASSALSPLYQALYARHVSLSAANRVHFGAAPAGTTEPYAVLVSDTENENVLVADRDGSPNEATVTVNYWDAHKLDALALYDSFLASVDTTPLTITGFRSISVALDAAVPLSDPDAAMVGVSARYRFTLEPST